jgi:hypothetical protein
MKLSSAGWGLLVGVVLLLVRIVLLLTEAKMGEDAEEVVMHGHSHSPVLLHEVGVVRKVLADLFLLLAQSVNSGCEVHDPSHDRVLITIACQSQWSYLRSIGTLHT